MEIIYDEMLLCQIIINILIWLHCAQIKAFSVPVLFLSFIPEVNFWNLNRVFMESVSHLALKLLSLMGERVVLFP